ncbi:MAG: RdgB/HAM1 family non-canonical purine NTP pyrophosphatase [Chromatiaceae bacterium]|nr:MAG: RdgB/HAM1 family non-canonical purine NTP pyrophosphatase [Chromatiaceae bacterium]
MPDHPPAAGIVLASNNPGKVREINALLAPAGIGIVAQDTLGIGSAAETGLTFVENAILKARHAARASGLAAIADDSGLEVDALAGAPGIHSARYAGEESDDAANCARLLAALAGVAPNARGARFQCLMVYLRHADDPTPLIAQGTWEGIILDAPRGSGGFGYDPLFWIPALGASAAELDAFSKNHLSHRGQALRQLIARLLPSAAAVATREASDAG